VGLKVAEKKGWSRKADSVGWGMKSARAAVKCKLGLGYSVFLVPSEMGDKAYKISEILLELQSDWLP
jgi:hypothetical protein